VSPTPPPKRCAIYARKSSDEGLEQAFNSLAAQRESAEALIHSRKSEAWIALPEVFEDGGFSGGNIERPALKRLLERVDAGDVDAIVLYRLDRLTRSIADFGKLMKALEAKGVGLVSVSESLDTTSASGRLMLHLLLSFAQYERELASDRTRDKIASSRRKGLWTGGRPILVYDFAGCKLAVNEAEAALVRQIFARYIELRSLSAVVKELRRDGITTKLWTTRADHSVGGAVIQKSLLSGMLSNPLYVGKVPHKGKLFDGQHEAIVDAAVFARVQEILAENTRCGASLTRNTYGGLLKGMLTCGCCRVPMVHTSTRSKSGVVHRYYVCRERQMNGRSKCPTGLVPAGQVEEFVVSKVKTVFARPEMVTVVFDMLRAKHEERQRDLQARRLLHMKDIESANRVLRQGGNLAATQRLSRATEQLRLLEIELSALNENSVTRAKVAAALAAFDPVWIGLSPSDRAKLLSLVVERVVLEDGKVVITQRETPVANSEEAA
jgi:site-specific DNA recombinase